MFIRKIAVLAVTAACLLVGASSASAVVIEEGGGPLPVGASIVNGASDPATLTLPGLGAVTCASTATTVTLLTNATSLSTGSLRQLAFTSCTDTIPFITISSCLLRGGTTPTVSLVPTTANAGTITLGDTIVRCFTGAGTTNHSSGCDYTAASANGATSNSPSRITFTGVNVSHVSGTTGDLGALCGSTGTFSTTLTDLRTDPSGATVTLVP